MRLIIDGHRLTQTRTGVGRYLERLLHHWCGQELPFDEVVCVVPPTTDATTVPSDGVIAVQVAGPALPGLLWENGPLRRAARGADVFFGASYAAPLWLGTPTVISNLGIYAGQPGTFPRWHRWRYDAVYRHSARRARRVIANSGSTKNDLMRYYGIADERITVVYPGIDDVFGPVADDRLLVDHQRSLFGWDEPYFLMVGKLSTRRHIPELIEAFARFRRAGGGRERLVIVGPNHLGMAIDDHIQQSGVADAITYRDFLPQSDLRMLYAGATAFVLPTTHEGFSFTILEALACGAPVLTVDHAPLREGVIDAVLALPRATTDDLLSGLTRVAGSPELRGDLRRRGLACAQQFSWARTAAATMAVLGEAATGE